MSTMDTMPAATVDWIISSIINWVCPKCGGYMVEYQCFGKCRRNWLSEWEWANGTRKNSTTQSSADEAQREELCLE